MRVLLAESDPNAARGVSLMLKADGAAVDQTGTGGGAFELAQRYNYDIILLELALPDIGGCEVIRRIRAARNDTPVLVLSGLGRTGEKVEALSEGADDFLAKPFDRAELIARIRAIIRRCHGHRHASLQVGPLQINLDSHEVLAGGKSVLLTGKEYAVLELLVLRKGTVLGKEAFLTHLYGGMDEPEVKIIDVFICKLRKKLAAAGAGSLIGTVWGRGYMIRDPNAGTPREHGLPHETVVMSEMNAA